MVRTLRVPTVLAVALLGCDGGTSPKDAAVSDSAFADTNFEGCDLYCLQDPASSVQCPDGINCAANGTCPAGCRVAQQKLFCIPDGTDAGVCPDDAPCVGAPDECPPGCRAVG